MTMHVKPTDVVRQVMMPRTTFIHAARATSMTTPASRLTRLINQAIDLLQPVSLTKLAQELGVSTRCLTDLRGDGTFIQPGCNAHMVLQQLTDKVAKLPVPQAEPVMDLTTQRLAA